MPIVIPPFRKIARHEPAPHRKRWTRRECAFLVENELLTGRYELIDGQVISKMGQKPPHSFVILRLNGWLVALFGAEFVRIQLPIDVAASENSVNEPEPDAAVTLLSGEAYLAGNPGPKDIVLVVEASDTTLRFDLRNKAALYARAAICEYWVVDIAGRRIVVHRQPTPQGYAEILAYSASEPLSPLARPAASVRVADLLPPA